MTTDDEPFSTAEATQPWVVYQYGRCLNAALREHTFGVVRGGEVFRNPGSRYKRCLTCGAGFVADSKRRYCRDGCRENRTRVAA